MHRPRIIAHRGASAFAPENTLPAFRFAIEAGAEVVETDAHLSRDGEIVLIHDADLRRTTSCSGSVAAWRVSELAACDAGYWFTPEGERGHPFRGLNLVVPRLSELIELAESLNPAVVVNVEIKNLPDQIDYDPTQRLAERLVSRLHDLAVTDRVLLSSFNPDAIDRVKQLDGSIRTALVCGPLTDLHARTAYARARQHDAIHLHHASLGSVESARRLIEVMHHAGLEVSVWTVNDEKRMLEMACADVDGIVTDNPEQLRRVLEHGAAEHSGAFLD